MLASHTTTHYHKRVPIQVGSRIIDQIVKSLTEEKLKSLSQLLCTEVLCVCTSWGCLGL